MFTLLIISLFAWSAALAYMAWQVWIAPEGFEDAHGFHWIPAPAVSRWHHVRFHHRRRHHRELRHHAWENSYAAA